MGKKQTTHANLISALDTARRWSDDKTVVSGRPDLADAELARLLDHSLDLLCVASFDGYFKYLNPAWTACLAWTLDELKATPFIDFVHPDDQLLTLAEVDKLAGGAEAILFENRYRHRDGSYRWLQWNGRYLPADQRLYGTARDVTQKKRLEREILEILDHERVRLGQELHDGFCQTLAGIAALSSQLSRSLAVKTESTESAMAAEITQLLHESIGEAHDLARALGPIGLQEADFDQSLETLAHNIEHLFDVSCTLNCDGPVADLRNEDKAHLYRIVQEAAHNGVVRGRADQITIGLSCKDGELVLSVRDDGVGIPSTLHKPEGIGMHTMAYRSRLIGASLEVRRRTSRGTVVSCVLPLPETPDTRENSDHVAINI